MLAMHVPGLIILTIAICLLAILLAIGFYYEHRSDKDDLKWEIAEEEHIDGHVIFKYRKKK